MVSGHSKNDCDSLFGHVKRSFREKDVITPADKMNVISESSRSTQNSRMYKSDTRLLGPFKSS